MQEIELSARLIVCTLGGDGPLTSYGANALAFRGARGTLLVDPFIAPAHAQRLASVLARRGWPPVSDVALTHHHTDHALGAGWFARQGARVAAQRLCAEAMAAQHPGIVAARRREGSLAALFADAFPYRPAVQFEERLVIDVGEGSAELLHLGHGHTPGDAVVLIASERAVAVGDLVFRGYHFNYEEADAAGAAAALDALARLPATTFVPGHGAPGGVEVLEEQALYHAEARRLVREAQAPAEVSAALRVRFPGHALAGATETAVDAWRRR